MGAGYTLAADFEMTIVFRNQGRVARRLFLDCEDDDNAERQDRDHYKHPDKHCEYNLWIYIHRKSLLTFKIISTNRSAKFAPVAGSAPVIHQAQLGHQVLEVGQATHRFV